MTIKRIAGGFAVTCFFLAALMGVQAVSSVQAETINNWGNPMPADVKTVPAISSWKATEVTSIPATGGVPVGHLQIENPSGDDNRQSGSCTATLIGLADIITAVHCFAGLEADATAVFTPLMHYNNAGVLVRPYGQCRVKVPYPVANVNPGQDVITVPLQSCSDSAGVQREELATLGATLTPVTTTRVEPQKWFLPENKPTMGVTAFGYPKYDQYGNAGDGTHLMALPTEPGSTLWTARQGVGLNVLVFADSLEVGASGGPIVIGTRTGPKLMSVISRHETWETVRATGAMSGPALNN